MVTRYVDSANGNEANAGTSMGAAWRYPPGMTGSTHTADVTTGDFVEIQNGSSYTGRRFIPVGGVTYQGYGLGGTQITIKKVVPGHPALTYDYEVARERGVHQGSWALTTGSLGSGEVLRYNNSGADVGDVVIDGSAAGTGFDTVQMATVYTVTNLTLRRACILNASRRAIDAEAPTITLIEVQALASEEDNVVVHARSTGDYSAGGVVTITDCDFRNPNTDRNGTRIGTGLGDNFQGAPTDGFWKPTLNINGLYCEKHDDNKQCLRLHDAFGGMTIRNLHVYGDMAGNSTVDLGSIRGAFLMEDAYFYEGCNIFPVVRMTPDTGDVPPPSLLPSTGSITLRRIISNCQAGGFAGMLTVTSNNTGSGVLEGQVIVEACIGVGPQESEPFVRFWKSGMATSIGSSFRARVEGNLSFISGATANLILDSSLVNTVRCIIKNNFFPAESTFEVQATSYASVALFQAADSAATGNNDSYTWAQMLVDETTWGFGAASPALAAGIWQPYSQAPRQIG